MPLYDFICSSCGNQQDDVLCNMSDRVIICDVCGEEMERQMPAIQFKFASGDLTKHKRKYGNNHHAIPKVKDNGVKFYDPRRVGK